MDAPELLARIHRERHASWVFHNSTTQSLILLRTAAFIAIQTERGCAEPAGERCKAGTPEWQECACGLTYDRALNQARSFLVKWETEDIEQERQRISAEAARDTTHI